MKRILDLTINGTPLTRNDSVPALTWLLKERKKNIQTAYVPYTGDLSVLDRAQIANWFEIHIAKDTRLRHKWITSLPIAHAFTVFISYRLLKGRRNKMDHSIFEQLRAAWNHQVERTGSGLGVDVDRECLSRLEERMFERSREAGIAGHFQWGRDAGDHQECWDPYRGIQEEWDHGDRSGSDGELLVSAKNYDIRNIVTEHVGQLGKNYIYLTHQPTAEQAQDERKPRPRPRPTTRQKKNLAGQK